MPKTRRKSEKSWTETPLNCLYAVANGYKYGIFSNSFVTCKFSVNFAYVYKTCLNPLFITIIAQYIVLVNS
jgi:hypothetical protein